MQNNNSNQRSSKKEEKKKDLDVRIKKFLDKIVKLEHATDPGEISVLVREIDSISREEFPESVKDLYKHVISDGKKIKTLLADLKKTGVIIESYDIGGSKEERNKDRSWDECYNDIRKEFYEIHRETLKAEQDALEHVKSGNYEEANKSLEVAQSNMGKVFDAQKASKIQINLSGRIQDEISGILGDKNRKLKPGQKNSLEALYQIEQVKKENAYKVFKDSEKHITNIKGVAKEWNKKEHNLKRSESNVEFRDAENRLESMMAKITEHKKELDKLEATEFLQEHNLLTQAKKSRKLIHNGRAKFKKEGIPPPSKIEGMRR